MEVQLEELEGLEEAELMQSLLGFASFGSTQGETVVDNQTLAVKGAASKHKQPDVFVGGRRHRCRLQIECVVER